MHLSMSSPRGVGGLVNPQEFDCDVYLQGGDFDHLIFQLQRAEKKQNHYFCQGVGILSFLKKIIKIPTLWSTPPPPPSGLTLIGA